jgi:hypothetical protein
MYCMGLVPLSLVAFSNCSVTTSGLPGLPQKKTCASANGLRPRYKMRTMRRSAGQRHDSTDAVFGGDPRQRGGRCEGEADRGVKLTSTPRQARHIMHELCQARWRVYELSRV